MMLAGMISIFVLGNDIRPHASHTFRTSAVVDHLRDALKSDEQYEVTVYGRAGFLTLLVPFCSVWSAYWHTAALLRSCSGDSVRTRPLGNKGYVPLHRKQGFLALGIAASLNGP